MELTRGYEKGERAHMAKSAREQLARLLGGTGPVGSFSARLSAPAGLIGLEVSGVGPVRLPLRAPVAKKLIAVARPAKFGRGEETLADASVRDTWELTPDQFTLDGPSWPTLLGNALEYFRAELALPRGSRLRAEPHSMLIYGKGQFFLPHQDSEKDDAMVGTLVVSLPSAHTGGELIIEHAGASAAYRASKDELTFVAFYADCRHEVTPVTSGYRHTLTFNLLADAAPPATEVGPAIESARCLTEHFSTPATPRYGGPDLAPPNRLVFLLDHEYTQRGLDWNRLKGADVERAALLRAAAERAGCETVLALAEVKETWDALPDGDDPWNDYNDYYEDEDEDEADRFDAADEAREDYQLNELIDDEITLDWWTGQDGTGGEPVSLQVHDYEVCAATPNASLTPYQSEYEGYMGNYGNTLDRWYRRAAVVVWPRERAFAARAEAGSGWALREIRSRVDAGDLAGARSAAESLAPFWGQLEAEAGLLTEALDAAEAVNAAGTAAMLLEPFHAGLLAREHADGLAAVAGLYGEDWTRSVIGGWFGSERHHHRTGLSEWVGSTLPGLHGALCTAGSPEVARLLASDVWRWLAGEFVQWSNIAQSDIRRAQLENLSTPLARLLEAVDDNLRDGITETLRAYADTVLECLMPALRLAHARGTAGLGPLARDCAQRLGRIAATPPRGADDWSISWTGCGCALCDRLGAFLGSRTQRVHEWPLAKDGRRHIHSRIDAAELPVRHQTRRQGRPYTLVLAKTDKLFTGPANVRAKAAADLAWLTAALGTV
ncbi:2OG-Fe(II) oxygenase [Streptomyces adelaidensis]|uniref:2OG-Fe(II) oxygenase n=1 Tax=Streptomyces adelaidensis TaxID=2796465 RepID=UPI001F201671|nr:2OG-Fe(II) oxygenase [Streptomyces adelaidensis]